MGEELQVPLLELALARDEGAERHFVTEGFTDLGDAEGELLARGREHVLPVEVDVLARLPAQVCALALTFDHAEFGFHEQVEAARRGERAATLWATIGH